VQLRLTKDDAQLSASQSIFRRVRGSDNLFAADVNDFRCLVTRRRDMAGRWWATATVLQQTSVGWRRVIAEREFASQEEAERYALEAARRLPTPPAVQRRPFRSGGFGLTRASVIDRNTTAMLDAPLAQAERADDLHHRRVHLSDGQLHDAARAAVGKAETAVFVDLGSLIAEVVRRRLWERPPHHAPSFAAYVLSPTGLAIHSDQKLLLLRTVLDVGGRHIGLWAEVLAEVEAATRRRAKRECLPIRCFRGASLRKLARTPSPDGPGIRYLPSGQMGPSATDGNLVRLQRARPEVFARVVAGEVPLVEAWRQREPGTAGRGGGPSPFTRALQLLQKHAASFTASQRQQLRELLAGDEVCATQI
jgi:hypothetical protein